MKRFFTWILVLGGIVGVFYLVGLIVPRVQVTTVRADFDAAPREVYRTLADVSSWPQWFPDVIHVSEGQERRGMPVWVMQSPEVPVWELEVGAATEPLAFVVTFLLDDVRHTLRFELKFLGEGTLLRVSEQLDCADPWLRARRLFWSEDGAVEAIITALGKRLGQEPRFDHP